MTTLGELVLRQPRAAALFERLGLQRLFAATRSDLETHMAHATTGDALCALREVAGGYRAESAVCSTHRTMLNSLRAFELEMHQHLHEENNVLFPRIRTRLAASAERTER